MTDPNSTTPSQAALDPAVTPVASAILELKAKVFAAELEKQQSQLLKMMSHEQMQKFLQSSEGIMTISNLETAALSAAIVGYLESEHERRSEWELEISKWQRIVEEHFGCCGLPFPKP